MMKPAAGKTPAAGVGVVEMDAIDGTEWERGQRTPLESDANLAALVKKSAKEVEPPAADAARKNVVTRAPTVPPLNRPPRASDSRSGMPAMPAVPDQRAKPAKQPPPVPTTPPRSSAAAPVAVPAVMPAPAPPGAKKQRRASAADPQTPGLPKPRAGTANPAGPLPGMPVVHGSTEIPVMPAPTPPGPAGTSAIALDPERRGSASGGPRAQPAPSPGAAGADAFGAVADETAFRSSSRSPSPSGLGATDAFGAVADETAFRPNLRSPSTSASGADAFGAADETAFRPNLRPQNPNTSGAKDAFGAVADETAFRSNVRSPSTSVPDGTGPFGSVTDETALYSAPQPGSQPLDEAAFRSAPRQPQPQPHESAYHASQPPTAASPPSLLSRPPNEAAYHTGLPQSPDAAIRPAPRAATSPAPVPPSYDNVFRVARQAVLDDTAYPSHAQTQVLPSGAFQVARSQPPLSSPASFAEPSSVPLPLPAPVESAPIRYPRSSDDRGAPPTLETRASARRRVTETGGSLAGLSMLSLSSSPPSRRMLLWCGAAVSCVALAAIVVFASRRPSDPSSPVAQVDDSAQAPAAAARRADAPPASVEPSASVDPPASVESARAQDVPPAVQPTPVEPAATAAANRTVKRFGGKKIVVEYNERPSEVAPGLVAQEAEDPAIGRARSAYVSGNKKLFAGDVAGAIVAYHMSLDLYPGYVGGYRGLGLAYAQLGDSQKALEALTTYLATVPNARDAPLIKKRIARLQDK